MCDTGNVKDWMEARDGREEKLKRRRGEAKTRRKRQGEEEKKLWREGHWRGDMFKLSCDLMFDLSRNMNNVERVTSSESAWKYNNKKIHNNMLMLQTLTPLIQWNSCQFNFNAESLYPLINYLLLFSANNKNW